MPETTGPGGPARQIAANAGVEGSMIIEEIRKGKPGRGYDAQNGEYTDTFKVGIVDPAKVARSALENAASIAAMVLTTEAVIIEIPENRGTGLSMAPDMM
jgi:chaperonin GroEL